MASLVILLGDKLALPNTSYITNTYDSVARLTGTYLKHSSNTNLNLHEYLHPVRYAQRPGRIPGPLFTLAAPQREQCGSKLSHGVNNVGNQRIRHTRTDSSYYTNIYPVRYEVRRRSSGRIRWARRAWAADAARLSHGAGNIGQLKVADSTTASEDRFYGYDAGWNLHPVR